MKKPINASDMIKRRIYEGKYKNVEELKNLVYRPQMDEINEELGFETDNKDEDISET